MNTRGQEVMEALISIGRALGLIGSCLKMLLVWGHWSARHLVRASAANVERGGTQ